MTPPDFCHPLRVYWEDTDAAGIVYYANYLKFFERARTEWLRAVGVGQQCLRTEQGLVFVVAETTLRCLQPARLDDLLDITVQVQSRGRASMTLHQQARRGTELVADASIRIGCVDAQTYRPRRIPTPLLQGTE